MSRNLRRIATIMAAIILITGLLTTFYLERFLDLDTYKQQIISGIEGSLDRKVSYSRGDFTFRFIPSFTFHDIVIKEKDGSANFITADHLTFSLALLPLLEKKLILNKMVLDHPVFRLTRDKAGIFNISDLLVEKKGTTPLQIKGFQIKKGEGSFLDQGITSEVLTTSLKDIDLSLNQLTRGKPCSFRLSTRIAGGSKPGIISMEGEARLPGVNEQLNATMINGKISLNSINAGQFWPYYNNYVPFRKLAGYFNLDSTFKGKLSEFKSRGTLKASNLLFSYPQVFRAPLTPRDLRLAYELDFTTRNIAINTFDLNIDGVTVKGSCAIRDIGSGDPRIVAKATSTRIRLEDFYGYIPYGIIVKDPADFIEQHVKGGTYRLEEGRLDGRVSQILHMEKGENYNILYINAFVEQGLISYGKNVPTFNSIKGRLEMRGKDFNLHEMSGKFGTSPITLNGKITDYPLDTPSGYPFTMNMNPRQPEIAWLLGNEGNGKVGFEGDSTLRLTGSGFTNGFNLGGEWNLSQVSYRVSDLVSKPSGRSNNLTFRGSINRQGAKITELIYNLSPLSLRLAADYRFSGKNPLQLDVKTNQFAMGEVYNFFPAFRKIRPSGKVQGDLHGKGDLMQLSDVVWGGDLNFYVFACTPTEAVKSVSNLTGKVHFQGEYLETAQLTAKIGSSTISARGTVNGFTNPTLNISFSSPALDVSDLGIRTSSRGIRVDRVQGAITMKDHNVQIKSLYGQIDESKLNIRGSVNDIRNPQFDLAITSPYLDLANLLLLRELEQDQKKNGSSTNISVKATIQASSGRFGEVPIKNLKATANYEDKILYLQPVILSAFDGDVSGKVRIDMGIIGSPRYQLSCNLDRVSADKFMHAIGGKKQEITGSLSITGEITAKGNSSDEIKKTMLGSVKLRCERGTVRKFSVLSKVFSILNVSQLLKFQLPNMVSGGMPYNRITGSIAIRDGVASTSDLFLDSDAINMSAVGKMDLIKEEIDFTIGVQPLQTVDKIVSHIPVVGWILSGKDKSLISTYFEAKGKVDDPVVTAIPVKAMAKGVFNIFKRVFELPGKLITDTGEVIMGK